MIRLFQVHTQRHTSPTSPCSVLMTSQFQEHGSCRITNDTTSVRLNPYSWNNGTNMLYIDQPVGVGVGWSYGKATDGTLEEAAVDMWKFMQIFLKDLRFQKYVNRSLGIFGKSYGGHYGMFALLCFGFFLVEAALRTKCWIFACHVSTKICQVRYKNTLPTNVQHNV
jgi:hypothetical protein